MVTADDACTRCGATPETGLNDTCPECRGIVEALLAPLGNVDVVHREPVEDVENSQQVVHIHDASSRHR